MTAPNNTDEEKLKHFNSVKPQHTGLLLAPDHRTASWWFFSEDVLVRFEAAHRKLFCRECAKEAPHSGKRYWPLLVEYQPDLLGALEALCSTHCSHCHGGEMYPVPKLTWSIGDDAYESRHFKSRLSQASWASQSLKDAGQGAAQYNALQNQLQSTGHGNQFAAQSALGRITGLQK